MSRYRQLLKYRLQDEAGGDGGDGGGGGTGTGTGDGGDGGDWRTHIPAEYASDPTLATVKDLPGLISQFVNGQRMIGGSIRIPGENADPADRDRFYEKLTAVDGVTRIPGPDADEAAMAAFYNKLGRPESAKDYEMYTPSPNEVPAGLQIADDLGDGFKEVAHKIGLSAAQAKELSRWYTLNSIEAAKQDLNASKEARSALMAEYGNQFDLRVDMAKGVIEKFGDKYAVEELSRNIGNMPGLAMMLADISLATTEDGMVRRTPDGVEIMKSATEVQAEIDDYMLDPAYANKNAPNHNTLVEKVRKLHEQMGVLNKMAAKS